MSNTAQPVAWKISYKYHDGSPRTVLCGHNSVGDYRDFDPYATSIPLSRSEYDEAMQTAYRISCATKQNTCRKCQGVMRPGQAIAQTCVGVPDFPGDKHAVTMSPGGPGKLIDCMKCVDCGWSRTMGHSPTKPDADEAYLKNMALRKMLDEMPIAHSAPLTGWPPGLLQDDDKGLSKWLSRTPNARQDVRDGIAQSDQSRITSLLREAHSTLEMWKDVAPSISLCKDIDAVLTAIAQPVQPAEPTCGIKAGENIEQAAEGWAQWCEVRGNQMLANFLRKVAQPVPPTKAAL